MYIFGALSHKPFHTFIRLMREQRENILLQQFTIFVYRDRCWKI